MRGQFRAATRVGRSGLMKVFLALAVSIAQVAVSPIGQVQAADPGNPVRIREIPIPKPDGASKADPGNPAPTKQVVPPPSTTENTTPAHASDKPE
jgi:hypothetical protein